MPGDIFGCHDLCVGVGATVIQWVEATRRNIVHKTASTAKNYLVRYVSAKVEKPLIDITELEEAKDIMVI